MEHVRARLGRRARRCSAASPPATSATAGWRSGSRRLQRLAMDPTLRREGDRDERRASTSARCCRPIQAPTLVLHRRDDAGFDVRHSQYLAEHIPERAARRCSTGDDSLPFLGDSEAVLGEIEEFLTGARAEPEPDRVLATVLFTDICRSTERAAELGDRRWRSLLEQHDAAVRAQLARHRGRADQERRRRLPGDLRRARARDPRRARHRRRGRAASACEIRAGLHTGECEVIGDDVGGLAVHIAARVMGSAGPSEVLVSNTVKDLVVGSELALRRPRRARAARRPGRVAPVGRGVNFARRRRRRRRPGRPGARSIDRHGRREWTFAEVTERGEPAAPARCTQPACGAATSCSRWSATARSGWSRWSPASGRATWCCRATSSCARRTCARDSTSTQPAARRLDPRNTTVLARGRLDTAARRAVGRGPRPQPPPPADLAPDDPCLITFTSGTAGEPKARRARPALPDRPAAAGRHTGWRREPGALVWCTAASGWSKSARNVFIAPWLRGAAALLHDARFDPAERLEICRARARSTCSAWPRRSTA